MPIRLSKKRINELVERTVVPIGSRRTGGGSGAGGGGGVSSSWVDEHYVSKDFFARLFTINGTQTENNVTTDVVVEPNDLETTITNIQAMVGLWTESYLSALGQGSGGGGGGGTILTEPLASINQSGIGSPTSANRVICWDGSHWVYKPYTTGNGTVTSIKITVPSGFSVNPSSAITTAGTFAISFGGTITKKYVLAAPSSADGTPSWRALVAADIPDLSSTYAAASYFDASGNAKTALKLTTVSKTAWGRTYWTANGVPDSIDGDIENAGNIKIDNNSKIYWKKYNTTTYLSMLTLDTSNNFIVGEAMANEGLTTYLRGRSITFQTGTGSSGNHSASMSDGGLFTVEKLKIGNIVISYDSTNGGLHVENAGIYADNYVSAHGANTSGGGGDFIPLTGSSSITGSLTPATHNTYNLGSPNKAWGTIYANNISGNASLSVQGVSCTTLSVSAYAVISSGAKFASICVESDSSGAVSSSRVGEINRYNASLHLQYDSGTANVTMCRQGFVFGTYTDGGGNNLSVISTNNRSLRIELGSSSLNPYISKPWNEGSDIRLKNIVKTIEDFDIQEIANAPVFDFTYKNDDAKIINIGTSAQYWQKVMPSAVKEMGDGYLSMNYGGTALAAAVLTARKVVNHEERIKALEAENERLRNEIEQLKVA